MKKICILTIVVIAGIIFASCGFSQGITGNIYDSIYGNKITDIKIKLKNLDNMRVEDIEIVPSKNGTYKISAKPGRYRIETDDPDLDYKRFIKPITIEKGVNEFDLAVEPIVKTWIHGLIAKSQPNKKPEEDYKTLIEGAVIEIDGKTSTTDSEGNFEIKYIRSGLKKISIKADGYKPYNKAYNLSKGESIEYFELEPIVDEDRSLVSSVLNLISFKAEILTGTSSKNISDSYMTTLVTSPYTFVTDSANGKYKFYLGLPHKFDEENNEFVLLENDEIEIFDFIKNSFKLLDDIGYYTSNTPGLKQGDLIGNQSGYSCSPYEFIYTDEETGSEYETKLWVIIDGKLETYPIKLSMFDKKNNKYFEISLFAFNSFENNNILN